VAQVEQTVAQVQAKLADVVKNGLSALDAAPLVQVAPLSFGVATKAGNSVANSSAQIVASALKVNVAGIDLPVIDAMSAVAQVNSVLATANSTLNSVLGQLNLPANLVSVSLLDQAKTVGMNGAYTQAVAGLTGLSVKIAKIDPAIVTGAISRLQGTLASTALGSAVSQVPLPMSTAMGDLSTVTGLAAPLTGGATVRIASLSGASTYTSAAAPGVGSQAGELPHTGSPAGIAVLGAVLAALALGVAFARRLPALAVARFGSPHEPR
jgi:hypothetical protein